MPNYPYLDRSGKRGFWRYRRSVPSHLHALIGVREVLMAFNTTVQEDSLPQYFMVAAETERQLDLAQAEPPADLPAKSGIKVVTQISFPRAQV